MKNFYFLLGALLTSLSTLSQNVVEVNASDNWIGYMNVFNLDGSYVFGSGWGVLELKTTPDSTGNQVILQPNFNTYQNAMNSGDPGDIAFWTDGAGGGYKIMEANTIVEPGALFNGQDLTFSGSVVSNTLDTGYAAYFFIKALDPNAGYQDALDGSGVSPIPASGNFSVSIPAADLPAGMIIQYGFNIIGINANPAEEANLGSIVLGPVSNSNVFDDIIAVSPNHTYLEAALIQAGLDVALQNPASSLTVFAPDDAAITALVTALGTTISGLLANPLLSDILLYHVVGSQVLSTALVNGPVVTLNGASVIIDLTSGVMVNTATVTTPDLLADNGVVHVINSVLVPPNLNISEFSISDLQLYPNPSIDVIKITNSVVENYSILSSNGVIVSSGKVINNEISVSHLDAGIYFLNLTVKGESQTIRIIKN